MELTPPDRRQPLDFAGLEIEEVHDHPRDAQQVAQPRKDRLRDLRRRLCGDHCSIDLVKERQTFGGSGERGRGSSLVSKRKPAEPGERRSQREPGRRGHEHEGAHPLEEGVFRAVDHDAPAERRQPAIRGEVDLPVDGVGQLGHAVPALEQPPNHGHVDVVRQMLHADSRAMEYELALAIHDEDIAARDLDRQQPSAQHVETLDGREDPDDPSVTIVNRHGEGHRRGVANVRLVDLGHVRLPGRADPAVPVPEGIAATVDLRRLRLGHPYVAGRIGEEHTVELREHLMQLAQVDQRFLRVQVLDALAEAEAPRVGAQNVEVPLFASLDRRGDATGNGVVLSEVLPLLDVGGPDEEQCDSDEHDEQEGGHDRIEPPGAVKHSIPPVDALRQPAEPSGRQRPRKTILRVVPRIPEEQFALSHVLASGMRRAIGRARPHGHRTIGLFLPHGAVGPPGLRALAPHHADARAPIGCSLAFAG